VTQALRDLQVLSDLRERKDQKAMRVLRDRWDQRVLSGLRALPARKDQKVT